jgi:hypothetical protein
LKSLSAFGNFQMQHSWCAWRTLRLLVISFDLGFVAVPAGREVTGKQAV